MLLGLFIIVADLVVILGCIVVLLRATGGLLMLPDVPLTPAPLLLALSGDSNDRRFARAYELLQSGVAPRLWLSAQNSVRYFGETPAEAAESMLRRLGTSPSVQVAPFAGDSTLEEVDAQAGALRAAGITRVILVTSDYHARRARAIWRRRAPDITIQLASAHDPDSYHPLWWHRRAWAKRQLMELERWLWWGLRERWRPRAPQPNPPRRPDAPLPPHA